MSEHPAVMSAADFKRQFEEALTLRDAGKPAAAVSRLESLFAQRQHHALLSGTIGTILLYEMNAPDRAVRYLQQAVFLSPGSEESSLALFHALLGTRESTRALDEARRFLSLKDSEEYRRLLAAMSSAPRAADEAAPKRTTGQVSGSGADGTEASATRGQALDTEPLAAVPPRLVVVLMVETARIPGGQPYAVLRSGIAQIRSRLQAVKGASERLDLYLLTFAGRVWSITEIKDADDASSIKTIGPGGRSDVNLERDGLLSALVVGTEAVAASLGDLRSRRLPSLRPWVVMLTAGNVDAGRERLVAEAKRILNPLRNDPGLNLFPVLIGTDGDKAALAELAGVAPLRLPDHAIDAFFAWLAESLEAALRAGAPGAEIRLPTPNWGIAA